eukprot:GHUV01023396.1.p1 GENE.GHUV01023396.1~~GHUV01023396.1.p1  ORF type:complete len:134 (+),score=28.89 GHUV01023396.1:825-1226(+)
MQEGKKAPLPRLHAVADWVFWSADGTYSTPPQHSSCHAHWGSRSPFIMTYSAPSCPAATGEGEGTGWTFAPAEVEPMVAAVSSAVQVYREQPDRWRALQLRGMADDCSWERAAQQYETVLTEVMQDSVQYTKK